MATFLPSVVIGTAGEGIPGENPLPRSNCVSTPSAALRFRVSATSAFSIPPGGTGGVLWNGTSTKGSNHTDVPVKAGIAAPDKIGISIYGEPVAVVAYVDDLRLDYLLYDVDNAYTGEHLDKEKTSSYSVVYIEYPIIYFTGVVSCIVPL